MGGSFMCLDNGCQSHRVMPQKDVESLWLMEKGPILVCFFSSDMMWHYVKFICGSYKLVQDKGQVKYKHLRIVLTWVNVLAPAEETLRKSGRRECGRWKMNCKIYRSQIDDILNIWGWISHFWLSAMYCFALLGGIPPMLHTVDIKQMPKTICNYLILCGVY